MFNTSLHTDAYIDILRTRMCI